MITRLNYVCLQVGDVEAAIAFYSERLGFRHIETVSSRPDRPWVEMKPPGGGPIIALTVGDSAHPAGAPVLFFGTDDLHATCADLERQGVSFLRPPDVIERGSAVIQDPSGNAIVLTSVA